MPNREYGLYATGLEDMTRVLKRSSHTLGPELKRRLGEGAGMVAPVARANAPFGSANNFGTPLRDTIKVGVTLRGASVYSSSVYGGAQNYGGRVGRHHATLLRRADVSQYMTRAVKDTYPAIARHVEETLEWLQRELRS